MRFKRARRGLDENKSFQRLIIGSKHHKATPEFHALMIVFKGNIFAIDFSFFSFPDLPFQLYLVKLW